MISKLLDTHLIEKLASRRECNTMKNSLKRDYLRQSLERYKNDPKRIWKTIKEFWPSNTKTNHVINRLNNTTDKDKMANQVNEHFATVAAKTLASGNFSESINDHLPPQMPPCFDFKEITVKNVADAINRLSSSKASSHDGVTAYMVKCAKNELIGILTYLFNRSLTLKVFPDLWKEAIVTPLFKSGNRDDLGNYRPISVLSTLGKLLERCVHDQCYEYLTSHNLLSASQSGFRKAHSTTTCLIDFLDNVYREVDGGVLVELYFWTFRKPLTLSTMILCY